MSVLVDGLGWSAYVESETILGTFNVLSMFFNPFPFPNVSDTFRVWRSPALARRAARDRALATGPVGMIDLTTLRSIGCRLDV